MSELLTVVTSTVPADAPTIAVDTVGAAADTTFTAVPADDNALLALAGCTDHAFNVPVMLAAVAALGVATCTLTTVLPPLDTGLSVIAPAGTPSAAAKLA